MRHVELCRHRLVHVYPILPEREAERLIEAPVTCNTRDPET